MQKVGARWIKGDSCCLLKPCSYGGVLIAAKETMIAGPPKQKKSFFLFSIGRVEELKYTKNQWGSFSVLTLHIAT
jgi:hypothetical protein